MSASSTSFKSYDEEVQQMMGAIASHSYDQTGGHGLQEAGRAHSKPVYISEVGMGGEGIWTGLKLAAHIIYDINVAGASLWCYWLATEAYTHSQCPLCS